MAALKITVLKRNAPWGPFTREQIEEGIKRGDFTLKYLAHAGGLPDWLPLGEVLDYVERHAGDVAPASGLPPIPQFDESLQRPPTNLPPVPEAIQPPPLAQVESRPPILPATPHHPPPPPVAEKVTHKIEPKPEPLLKPAPFFLRAVAFFFDGAIIFMPVAALALIGALCIEVPAFFHHISHQSRMEEWDLLGLNASRLSWLIIGFGWLYGAAFESSTSQGTIGKKWLGLKVTDDNGERVAFFRAVGRNIAKYFSAVPCFIGYFLALIGSRHLAFHDRVSDTRVVRR